MSKPRNFAYSIGDFCKIRHNYVEQFAIVISADFKDPDDSEYNLYTLYLQKSGCLKEVCEFAIDLVEYK